MRVQLFEQGLVVLKVTSTSMETQDTHEDILIIRQVGHGFDVFNMGMLEKNKKGGKSVHRSTYMYNTRIYKVYTSVYIYIQSTDIQMQCTYI